MPREGLLSKWAPVIVTNILPEEIVSVGYNHEKLLKSELICILMR